MNIVINYDFFKEVQNAKEKYGLLKVARNQKNTWMFYTLPTLISLDLLTGTDVSELIETIPFQALTILYLDYITHRIGGDIYRSTAEKRLHLLLSELEQINISTSYDLLLETCLYAKKLSIKLSDIKLPYLLEEKYYYIPTYDSLGEVKDTSILQEHIIGSLDYVLSIGSPSPSLKLAYSNS